MCGVAIDIGPGRVEIGVELNLTLDQYRLNGVT
jgi:hypothetical protein